MKFFGLKFSRFAEWFADIRAEQPGPLEFLQMGRLFVRMLANPRRLAPARADYLHRLSVCERCPIFDRTLKRCRSKDGRGCGCYVPFKALAPVDCWLREQDPSGVAGWGVADYFGR